MTGGVKNLPDPLNPAKDDRSIQTRCAMPGLLHSVRIPLLVLLYQVLVVVANVGFKRSAESTTAMAFLAWQVLGNLAGFLSVLTYTALLRWLPVHVAVASRWGWASPASRCSPPG